ncbi:hypothetical protein [Ferrovibrio sp.]|uniref:hypothetical protein n=1 Tax=Ferrovibrio sp. TaxID=1917215 RepID=UPI003D13D9CA
MFAPPALAQSLRGALDWLPPGSLNLHELTQRPQEIQAGGERQSFFAEYGRLAFRSPDVLGGNARKAGLSCQACHPNGDANRHFFIPGLSDRPGRIDVTHSLWSAKGDDGRANPLEIPSLRGVKGRHRLGFDRRLGSLREFTRNVIVLEFDGAEPEPLLLDALVAYQQTLAPGLAPGQPPSQAPGQVPEQPLRFEDDLRDFTRALGVLRLPLAEENAALTNRVTVMLRSQVGFMHERFEETAPQQILEGWSQELRGIAVLADASRWPEARDRLGALRQQAEQPPAVLMTAAPRSLYDPEKLRIWLSKPVR